MRVAGVIQSLPSSFQRLKPPTIDTTAKHAVVIDFNTGSVLLDKGAEHCAKKFGEEAVETVIAAVENDRDHLIAESADLLFHLLVLLKSRGVKFSTEAMDTPVCRFAIICDPDGNKILIHKRNAQ